MLVNHISQLIGNTPILTLDESVHNIPNLVLHCKLEYLNPFGSIKDRPASYFLNDMQATGAEKIIESSSGNTIKALAGLANTYGIPTTTITNRIKIPEQLDLLRMLGVTIEQLPNNSECIDFSDHNNPISRIEKRCAQDLTLHHTNQYNNKRNIDAHYETTGREIIDDLSQIDYFFSGLGTTGSSRGILTKLQETHPLLQSVGIVSGSHDFIPGIRTIHEMDEVGIFQKNLYSDIISIDAVDAVEQTVKLIKKTGMLCGPTTGAIYQGILNYFSENPPQRETYALFIACDRVEPYISYIKERLPELFHAHHKQCILSLKEHDYTTHYKTITVKQLETIISETTNKLLIDTRSNKSYILGHIHGSINIPLSTLEEMVDHGKPFPKEMTVILLCALGEKNKKLCTFLNKRGYSAYSLSGGVQARKKAMHPLEISQ